MIIYYLIIITYLVILVDWVSAWLGRFYSKLFLCFGDEPFSLEEVRREMGLDGQRLRVMLSRLREAGYVEREARGVYRALDPVLVLVGVVCGDWERRVRQKEYVPLIRRFLVEVFRGYGGRVCSVVLFGSVARGVAGVSSDLDLLLVVRGLPGRYGERVRELSGVLEGLTRVKLDLWRSRGIFADVNVVLLTPKEAAVTQPFYLDMVADSVIIYDRNNFMRGVLGGLRAKLERLGAKKIVTPSGGWFWQLKDRIGAGEVVEL